MVSVSGDNFGSQGSLFLELIRPYFSKDRESKKEVFLLRKVYLCDVLACQNVFLHSPFLIVIYTQVSWQYHCVNNNTVKATNNIASFSLVFFINRLSAICERLKALHIMYD